MKMPEELLPVVEWWEKNGKKAVVIAVVAGLIGLAGWSWKSRRDAKIAAASDATVESCATCVESLMAMDNPQTPDVNEREAALTAAPETIAAKAEEHADSACAVPLKLLQASATFARGGDGDYEAALAIYEELAKDEKLPLVYKDIPALGRAHCLEALKRYDEAAEAYAAVSTSSLSAYVVDARLGQARALAASGKKAEAIALVKETAASADNMVDQQAVQIVDMLVKGWVEETPAAAEAK